MKISRAVALGSLACTLLLSLSQPALGATRAGNECVGESSLAGKTVFGAANPPGSLPASIPAAGVITSWTLNLHPIETPEPQKISIKGVLKVLAPTGPGGGKIAGESGITPISFSTTAPKTTTASTRIPVAEGSRIGTELTLQFMGATQVESLYCEGQSPATKSVVVAGSPSVGAEARYEELSPEKMGGERFEVERTAVPITVVVEPDADGDGFGDLTQDPSPGDPFVHPSCGSTRLPCPGPAAGPLRARAVPHEEAVAVSVTTTVASTVRATGRVKLGKRTLTLTSSAKHAEVGKPNKFMLAFPPVLEARLAQMSPKSSLKAEVIVTSPGLEPAKSITLKLRGQAG